ncbi:Crp/Fnr family transcriptional regulator [Bdellovibrio bacteriovorus]|uniref:Crp/Fnr family transcriptional regulator n=1 Tax=Bdellovibrio bacteriovorus TaxID=959 RepID=A0A150WUI0_BDEBC|nr:Crp/Fnr family transcriptional regulator [Bdellovibrio bacteriovorus]KYG70139.1 hypothetical protein AZI85_15760 [Bdellovibrio bacteriovorus]
MTDPIERIRSLDYFSALPERVLKDLSAQCDVMQIPRKKTLFQEDTLIQDLYIVLFGSFKVAKKAHGSGPLLLNFLGRGEFLGIALAGLTYPKYPATLIAQENSALLKFPREFFLEYMMKIESVRHTVNRQIGERFLELQNDRCMENVLIHQRVADMILRLWERQGDKGHRILIPTTRQDIAQRVGTTTETVIRIMSQWHKQGILATVEKHIEIIDEKRLREMRQCEQFHLS